MQLIYYHWNQIKFKIDWKKNWKTFTYINIYSPDHSKQKIKNKIIKKEIFQIKDNLYNKTDTNNYFINIKNIYVLNLVGKNEYLIVH